MHVRGSAPLRDSLNRSRYIAHDDEGDPGRGMAIFLPASDCDVYHDCDI